MQINLEVDQKLRSQLQAHKGHGAKVLDVTDSLYMVVCGKCNYRAYIEVKAPTQSHGGMEITQE